ncbi:uncharacterized protein [Triticum aestivum]|uniref:uncharacterized protein isoform X1 n=1 Tax=Triticum aestivum TaxID=4565 RepID=UPI001D02FED7|nr:uncharacterized protein LOC123160851 isoform X1 [Triticum aestivum]
MSESGAGCLHVGGSACGAGRLLEPGVSCCRFKAGHILEPCTSFCGLKVVPRCGLQPVGGMASRSANILVASAALRPPASEPPTRVFIFCPWAESIRQVHRIGHRARNCTNPLKTPPPPPPQTLRLRPPYNGCLVLLQHACTPLDQSPARILSTESPAIEKDMCRRRVATMTTTIMSVVRLALLRAEGQGTERTTARLTRRPETLLPLPPWILADAHLRHRRAPPLETSRDQDYQLCHGLASAIAAHHRSGHYRDRDYQLCHGLALWNHRRSRCQDPAVLLAG